MTLQPLICIKKYNLTAVKSCLLNNSKSSTYDTEKRLKQNNNLTCLYCDVKYMK